MVTSESPHSVAETLDRAASALAEHGVKVFARIDHGGAARDAGLELADEEVLIFGDPRAGTLLMQQQPAIGYDLPLRIAAWDANGTTTIAYRTASDIAAAAGLSSQAELLGRMDGLLAAIAAAAAA